MGYGDIRLLNFGSTYASLHKRPPRFSDPRIEPEPERRTMYVWKRYLQQLTWMWFSLNSHME